MKKWICIFITAAILFCLSACTKKPPAIAEEYTVNFTVTQDAVQYAGSLEQCGDSLTVAISEPYAASGMSFTYEGEELHIDYGGHSTIANSDYISSLTIPAVLHNTLTYQSSAEYRESDDEGDHYCLPTPYGSAELIASQGIPTALHDEHSGLDFRFQLP